MAQHPVEPSQRTIIMGAVIILAIVVGTWKGLTALTNYLRNH